MSSKVTDQSKETLALKLYGINRLAKKRQKKTISSNNIIVSSLNPVFQLFVIMYRK